MEDKIKNRTISVTIPQSDYDIIRTEAKKQRRSMKAQTEILLLEGLEIFKQQS